MNRATASSYYDLLEVHPSSTADEIKRAYYRKIRIFTNEAYPEQFKELRKAYETLSDPVRKRSYDVELFADPQTQKNRQNIDKYMMNENFEHALRVIKQEILNGGLTPELLKNRVICELRLGNYKEVIKQLHGLDISIKDDELFFYFYSAIAYRETARYHEAEQAARKLMLLDPEMAEYQVLYASIFNYQNKYNELKYFYNELIQTKNLNIEHITLLLDYITLQHKVTLTESEKKKLVYAILSLPKNAEDREAILSQMIDYIHAQEWISFVHAREICDLAGQMNTGNLSYISSNIRVILDDIYSQEAPNEQERRTDREQRTYDEPTYAPVKQRGNIIIAIILGLILSAPLSVVGGIIGGIAYYYLADKIWRLVGWLLVIFIVIAILAGIFAG